ncbi:hypothetical protein [Salinispora oceanensis]|uniref:hypothetical protein n=1 Tax=Salinispora oceanensis TaxID=1050199 RepID=UPI0013A5A37A|nr:hypothetical protein [Salinispora oceanensis]
MAGGSTRPELRPYPHGSQSIVSGGQLNVWLHDQRIGTGARYIIPIAIRVCGQLDVAALRRAFDDVVTRETLCTSRPPGTAKQRRQTPVLAGQAPCDLARPKGFEPLTFCYRPL